MEKILSTIHLCENIIIIEFYSTLKNSLLKMKTCIQWPKSYDGIKRWKSGWNCKKKFTYEESTYYASTKILKIETERDEGSAKHYTMWKSKMNSPIMFPLWRHDKYLPISAGYHGTSIGET